LKRFRQPVPVCLRTGLVVAVLVLTSLVAAAPSRAEDDTAKAKCTDDAILVFDGSGSMASVGYNEMDNPRIEDARQAVREVLPRVAPYRRIGLVTYGPGPKDACSNIDLVIPPEYNTDRQIIAAVDGLVPDGDTPLTQAVQDAAEILNYREKPAVIVLVTDGDETCGGAPCRIAQQLMAEGVATVVHVIGFRVRDKFFAWQSQIKGARSGEVVSRCLAETTGGKFVATETTEELVAALQVTLGCPLVTERR
jgi:Ca-activated chloride channel homolog